MSEHLLSGGPAEGIVSTDARSQDGRLWTIEITHGNCACDWCKPIDSTFVTHIYEARDDDIFIYRESLASVPPDRKGSQQ